MSIAFWIPMQGEPYYGEVNVHEFLAHAKVEQTIFDPYLFIAFEPNKAPNPILDVRFEATGNAVFFRKNHQGDVIDLDKRTAERFMFKFLRYHVPLHDTPSHMIREKTEIGKPFTYFNDRRTEHIDSGAYLEALADNQGFMFVIYMKHMSDKEKKTIRDGASRLLMYEESMFSFTYVQLGPLIFESTFDPFIYPPDYDWDWNPDLFIVAVESTNQVVQVIRHTKFPSKWIVKQQRIQEAGKSHDHYSKKYTKWQDDLRERYTMEQLHERGTYLGKLGTM